MIGIILVSHGDLSQSMHSVVEHILGPQENFFAMSIKADDFAEQRRQELLEKTKELDSGDGVVLITDMFGGTPSNLAVSILDQANVEVIAGVNIPMLVKLCSIRKTTPLKQAVQEAQDAGRKYIYVASEFLND